MRALLDASGFRVRGKRADCVHCSGGSRGTVAFTDSVAFCHRCRWTGSARRLAREQGIAIPASKIGRSRIRKAQFRAWLGETSNVMANQERCLARRAEWAKAALHYFPEMESAWVALATWYHTRRSFELFFEAAQDRIGRFTLYKSWRAADA
jgi:hypothetical protein